MARCETEMSPEVVWPLVCTLRYIATALAEVFLRNRCPPHFDIKRKVFAWAAHSSGAPCSLYTMWPKLACYRHPVPVQCCELSAQLCPPQVENGEGLDQEETKVEESGTWTTCHKINASKVPFSCKFHVVKWPPEHTTISDIIFEHGLTPPPPPLWTMFKKTALFWNDGFPYLYCFL